MKLKRIVSLTQLHNLAEMDSNYRRLAMISARNLGGSPVKLDDAMTWLYTNATETNEAGVVGEVNFCRDLVK